MWDGLCEREKRSTGEDEKDHRHQDEKNRRERGEKHTILHAKVPAHSKSEGDNDKNMLWDADRRCIDAVSVEMGVSDGVVESIWRRVARRTDVAMNDCLIADLIGTKRLRIF